MSELYSCSRGFLIERHDDGTYTPFFIKVRMEDIVDQIEQITQKQIEINIKKFRMQLEIRLQMGEAAKDWNNLLTSHNVRTEITFTLENAVKRAYEEAKKFCIEWYGLKEHEYQTAMKSKLALKASGF